MSFSPEYNAYIGEEPVLSIVFNDVITSTVALEDEFIYEPPNPQEP